jgi:hypothetical protein
MSATHRTHTATVRARATATAWLNAFLACGQDDERPSLYRTISVEFFPNGIQFVCTNGHALLRTWSPTVEAIDESTREPDEGPELAVVVRDVDHFARTFLATVLSATTGDGGEFEPMSFTVSQIDDEAAPALGEELARVGLTIAALGQELHCPLFEQEYPNWRALDLGIDASEYVDGMSIGPRMFSMVGKLRNIQKIDCTFAGSAKAIRLHACAMIGLPSPADVHGLLMPMRREVEKPMKVSVEVVR